VQDMIILQVNKTQSINVNTVHICAHSLDIVYRDSFRAIM